MGYVGNSGWVSHRALTAGLCSAVTIAFATVAAPALAQPSDVAVPPSAPAAAADEAAAASAEPADEAPSSAALTDEIVVTGSRIRQPGLASPTPVTSVSNVEMDKISPGSLANALDNVPAFFNNSNASTDSSSNVPSGRGSNANLRGLDPSRTLVLLDGRRVVPGSKFGTVNIDLIPQTVVQRVDVVTGGASAAYGTDAVAGVVNFVLDKDFEGVRGNVQAGISSRGDNENGRVELMFGTPIGERLHLIAAGDIFRERGIEDETDRDWFARGYGTIVNPAFTASGTLPRRIRVADLVPVTSSCGGLIVQPGSRLNNLEFQHNGTVTPFVFTALRDANNQSVTNGGSGCFSRSPGDNDGPKLSNDVSRENLFGHLSYELGNNFTLFGQVVAGRNKTGQQGQTALFGRPWQLTIFRDNAFLPASVAAIMDAERRTSFTFQKNANQDLLENAKFDVINKTVQFTTGFDATLSTGSLFDGWNVNGYGQYGKTRQLNVFYGSAHWQHIVPAVDAVVNPATGQIVCRAALFNAAYSDCVPLNFFGVGNISEAAHRYATTPLDRANAVTHQFDVTQKDVELVASGEVWAGWAAPITAAFGANYRKQQIESDCLRGCTAGIRNTDPGLRGVPSGIEGDPDTQVFGSYADVDGGFDVKEVFTEANIPLLKDSRFARSLAFAPSVRYADYQGSGGIWAYKLGLDWDVNDQLRLRGTYSRDVRAATLGERFDRQRASGSVTDDPVTRQSYIFSSTVGGNPNVAPEKANTITLGAVYQPSWFNGFNATIDYYKIDIKGAIGLLGAQAIIDQCARGAQSLCDLISRDPVSQFIFDVQNIYINLNKEKASGVDVELNYRSDVNIFGDVPQKINIRLLGTWLIQRQQVVSGVEINLDGQIPAGGDIRSPAYPKFVANALVTYDIGPFSVFLSERYYNGGTINLLLKEGVDIDYNHVSNRFYTDLRVAYTTGAWEFSAQAINLTDQHPPLENGYNTSFYDIKGRRFVIGARFHY